MSLNIASTLKAIAVGAAVSLLPLSASAAVFDPPEGNSITLTENYNYSETIRANEGADEREFVLTADAPLRLDTRTNTLEFTGEFVNLQVSVENIDGSDVRFATETQVAPGIRLFTLDTIFNTTNALQQVLVVKWDNVIVIGGGSTNAGASLSIQAFPSAVPVPAAGLLLLTAVGGAVALRRRKKAA